MEAVLFCGIQATGKSTFYAERFFHTHVRVSRDLLKTARREAALLRACLDTGQPFVVDRMNLTPAARAPYIAAAKAAGFRVRGFYFRSAIEPALKRNKGRKRPVKIPDAGVLGAYKRLVVPTPAEGFDELSYVRVEEKKGFVVEAWDPDAEP